jgi:hypothetical protein
MNYVITGQKFNSRNITFFSSWRDYKGESRMDNQLMERVKDILETLTELRGHL